MSVKMGLLALLAQGPQYGYQLRAAFEESTASTWPLNVGQVYTTLTRLERDELVEQAGVEDTRVLYRITDAGTAAVADWFMAPVERNASVRDELAIKLVLAVTVPGVDVGSVIQRQRTATMAALQGYVREKRATTDLAAGLVLDGLVFASESEIRWLDHCEDRLRQAAAAPRTNTTTPPTEESAR
ncbi:DNA-binding PadR family transcriptional regulator [Marmoricola sp. OAE513]|uniref:PadR family transcriptional regulator n=1 Tax=Marmoricola sp. OAE513 TaxID=2817894 RepID=UPI001AE4FBFE